MDTGNTIVVDDAGGGNVLGGLVVGAWKGREFRSEVLGPEWCGDEAVFQPVIASVVLGLVRNWEPAEKVVLCRTRLFDRAARDLSRCGYVVRRARINGVPQRRTEEAFFHHLLALGLPDYLRRFLPGNEIPKEKSYRRLNESCAGLLLADPRRLSLAKGKCRTVERIRNARIQRVRFTGRIRGRRRFCVECGRTVDRGGWRVTGAGRRVYVHAECASFREEAL
ncbi:MAG: hypothetical protein D6679_14480 [Candidatus Hydrogenedentota bacterium]|nr:MAG: hypothetical protein D6679_14480 [Candidatus Hydrogenedentota bacterium]